jgi:hypothetical protein
MLKLNPCITYYERALRDKMRLKPCFCGSCLEEQRVDDDKYCHNCQKDPFYNPYNLDISNNQIK